MRRITVIGLTFILLLASCSTRKHVDLKNWLYYTHIRDLMIYEPENETYLYRSYLVIYTGSKMMTVYMPQEGINITGSIDYGNDTLYFSPKYRFFDNKNAQLKVREIQKGNEWIFDDGHVFVFSKDRQFLTDITPSKDDDNVYIPHDRYVRINFEKYGRQNIPFILH